jgi:hypothetical protein
MSRYVTSVQSEGDLEVVVLHELHAALAEIIGPDLYTVTGDVPHQGVMFHNAPSFKLFLIMLTEIFASGTRSTLINNEFANWSLLQGIDWLCWKHPREIAPTGLNTAVNDLTAWLANDETARFWCGDLGVHVSITISNGQLISFAANTAKHRLLRLSDLIRRLDDLCTKSGHQFTPQELVAVLSALTEEVDNRLIARSAHVLSYLGNIFRCLNAVILERFNKNPTNRIADMQFPEGITSDVFRDLYGSVLVFKRYEESSRIRQFTPVVSTPPRG